MEYLYYYPNRSGKSYLPQVLLWYVLTVNYYRNQTINPCPYFGDYNIDYSDCNMKPGYTFIIDDY